MNTCEQAWRTMQDRHNAGRLAFRIETRRKLAPAGQFSDGARAVIFEPCSRFRWLIARDGAGVILAEVDQREHWEDPQGMLDALEAKLGGLAPYRSEFTPAGEQLTIPGCEQDAPQTGTQQLDLF